MLVTKEELMERVRRGAELLDNTVPEWEERVKAAGPLTAFEMERTDGLIGQCGCIVGRAVGGFDTDALMGRPPVDTDDPYGWYVAHHPGVYGFDIGLGDMAQVGDRAKLFELLAECWNDLLAEREAARAKQAEV